MLSGEVIVINGENMIMGRLASVIARKLLEGNRVVVVNAEKIAISGNKRSIVNEYKAMLEIGTLRNPKRGPKHFRLVFLMNLSVINLSPYLKLM